jgi:hypothetical protein
VGEDRGEPVLEGGGDVGVDPGHLGSGSAARHPEGPFEEGNGVGIALAAPLQHAVGPADLHRAVLVCRRNSVKNGAKRAGSPYADRPITLYSSELKV